jgi:hypothetical protein
MEFLQRLIKKIRVEIYRIRSGVIVPCVWKRYKNIQNFCLFIGYPRSGHTLIASLLNAHPEVMIGMEWGVLLYLQVGFRKNQLFYSLDRSSKLYSKEHKNTWTGYSYHIENSWQGSYSNLKVIGDKFGGRTAQILKDYPELLPRLEKELNIPIKLLHVIRNPYDTITTATLRFIQKNKIERVPDANDILKMINSYFDRAETIKKLKEEGSYYILDIYHEKFIEDPVFHLKEIIEFFSLEAEENYFTQCATIVNESPKKTRYYIKWDSELINSVANRLMSYDFLRHYSYND